MKLGSGVTGLLSGSSQGIALTSEVGAALGMFLEDPENASPRQLLDWGKLGTECHKLIERPLLWQQWGYEDKADAGRFIGFSVPKGETPVLSNEGPLRLLVTAALDGHLKKPELELLARHVKNGNISESELKTFLENPIAKDALPYLVELEAGSMPPFAVFSALRNNKFLSNASNWIHVSIPQKNAAFLLHIFTGRVDQDTELVDLHTLNIELRKDVLNKYFDQDIKTVMILDCDYNAAGLASDSLTQDLGHDISVSQYVKENKTMNTITHYLFSAIKRRLAEQTPPADPKLSKPEPADTQAHAANSRSMRERLLRGCQLF
jgi:hypothetical protein